MNQLPTGGGGASPVQYRIEVDDQGTPVFRRFSQTAQTTLQAVERQGKAALTSTGAAAETMGKQVEGTGHKMVFVRGEVQHLQHAFGILGFHLASVGSEASRTGTALVGLAAHGFSALSLGVAAVAAGLGVLIMRHHEATEAAEKQKEAEQELYETARKNALEVRSVRDPGAVAKDLKDRIATFDAQIEAKRAEARGVFEDWRKTADPYGIPGGRRAMLAASDENIEQGTAFNRRGELAKIREEEAALAVQRMKLRADLARIEGMANVTSGHATGPGQPLTESDKEALFRHEAARKKTLDDMEKFDKEVDSVNAGLQSGALSDHETAYRKSLEDSAAFDKQMDEINTAAYNAELFNHEKSRKASIEAMEDFDKQLADAIQEDLRRAGVLADYQGGQARDHALAMAPSDDARRLLELQLQFAETMRNLGPNATADEKARAQSAYGTRLGQLQGEDNMALASKYGKGVAGSLVGDFNQELTRAVLESKIDLQRLAQSFTQSLVSAFFSSLTEATIQKPMETLFTSFFNGLIGTVAPGGSGGSSPGGVSPTAPSGSRGPDLRLTVETRPVVVASEVGSQMPRRTKQEVVTTGLSLSGSRGFKAPA